MTDQAAQERDEDERAERMYRAIGRYVVEFSQMMLMTEVMVRMLAYDRHQGVAVILARMEASQLTDAYFSLCALRGDWSDDDRAVVKALRREVRHAVETRNRIAHDVWFVGGSDEGDYAMRGVAMKAGGYELRRTPWSAEDLGALSEDLSRLREMIAVLASQVAWAASGTRMFDEREPGTNRRIPRDPPPVAAVMTVDERGRVCSARRT